MSLRFRIIFASACAVLAALVALVYADHVRAEAESVRSEALARYGGELVSLAVATEALEPGDIITTSNVTEREWVADLAPEGAYSSLDEVLGMEVTVPVAKNAPLSSLAFRDVSDLVDVPKGHVAVTVPVNDSLGLARGLAQGTRVIAYRIADGTPEVVSSEVTVLSAPSAQSASSVGLQVTLAVAAEDVPEVLAASAAGELRVVLPADDVTVEKQEPVGAPEVLDEGEESKDSEESAEEESSEAETGSGEAAGAALAGDGAA